MSDAVLKNSSLIERLEAAPDPEAALDEIRVYKKEREQAIRNEDLAGRLKLPELFEALTALAQEVLEGALRLSEKNLAAQGHSLRGPFAVVAMGKFGGRELSYGSDLDLIYLYDDPADQEAGTRLGQRIISALILPTRKGSAYKIDTALRPSGNAGTLVARLASFEEYHRTLGRTWEKQSLIKARLLFAPSEFLRRAAGVMSSIAYQRHPPTLAGEIDRLRRRMEREIACEDEKKINLKTGRGGLVDIEFATQYLQMVHGWRLPEVRLTGTLAALGALGKANLLPEESAVPLTDAYLFVRGIETRMRMVMEQPIDTLERDSELLRKIEGFFPGHHLWEEIVERRERVRKIYRKILGV